MPIYIRCPNCKTDQSIRSLAKDKKQNVKSTCKKCGEPFPRQGKVYRVRVECNGRVVTKTVPNSLELARQIEAKIKSELVAGQYYDRRKKTLTLNDVWCKYLDMYKIEGKAWQKEVSRYNSNLRERFGGKPLDRISPMSIQKLVLDMQRSSNRHHRPYSNKTIRNVVELLSRLFNFAKKQRLWDGDNPCKGIRLPKINNVVTNFLETDKIKDLLNALSEHHDRETANIIRLLLFTGIRRGEAFKLKWSDVDMRGGWLHLRDPKGGKDEIIPLNNLALDVLKDQLKYKRENTDLVFPSRKGTVRSDIKRAWSNIKQAADLPSNFRLHDLRHTYATLLASSGEVDLYTLQRLLTHKSPLMTQRYAHLLEGALRKGVKTLEKVLEEKKGKVIKLNR